MKVSKVHIKNFRILHNICLTLDNITTIVGANGSGKSTLLHALHAFFDPKFKPSKRDFWHEDTSQTIEITLEFVGLTAKEKQEFTKYVHKDTLKVTKTFKIENGELQQKYFGYILYFPAFEEIRRSQDVRDMVAKYDEFRKNHPDFNLKEAKKKNEIIAELERWENEHPDRCEETQSEHQFFGFKEVGGGKIDKYLKFLFVPAVKDPAKEADEEGKGWFSELVDTLIRSQITNNPELRKLNDKVKKEYKEKLNTLEVHKLQNSINQTLPHYAPNTSVKLKWNTDEFDPLTTLSLKVSLVEDGYETDLIQAGHGAQRAFLMTLSQSLGDVLTEGDKTLILGIEEPELYQHPTRLRHIARNLYASSTMANQNSRLQLILVTHSPYFITVEALDTLRRFRKSSGEIHVAEMSLEDIVKQLCDAHQDPNYFTIEALRAKLRTIMTPWISEGFFASGVVLVEGEEDKAFIQCYAEAKKESLEKHDIAVIPCSGKTNLDKYLLIFKKLEIPTYVIWDNDQENKPQNKWNDVLLRLNNANVGNYKTQIKENYACFENNFGSEVKERVNQRRGQQHYEQTMNKQAMSLGITGTAEKNPEVICATLKEIVNGSGIPILDELLRRIAGMKKAL